MDYDKQNKAPDDVEKSLELLDKVLSEFEDPDSLPPVEPESPSQGHQSEDDGYMSMNGRRSKFAPDFQPTNELSSLMAPQPPIIQPEITDEKSSLSSSPPPPEEAERIISSLLPKVTSPVKSPMETAIIANLNIINRGQQKKPILTTSSSHESSPVHDEDVVVPKVVNNHINIINNIRGEDGGGGGDFSSCIPGNIIIGGGVYISKQHNTENNTSPETIQPSQTTLPKTRTSPAPPYRFASLPSTSPPRGILGLSDSLDDGRTVLGIGISAVHDAVLRGIARIPEPILNEHPVTIYPGRASPQRRNGVPPRTLPGSIERHREVCRNAIEPFRSDNSMSPEMTHYNDCNYPISPASSTLLNQIFINSNLNRMRRKHTMTDDDNSDDFSDDSLEDSSLPPPPPPPIVPPPPSLSCPVTPSKRSSIAWDINLEDPTSFDDPLMKIQRPGSTKIITKRRGHSVSGSQSSLASTPGQSTESNKRSNSAEWPDPPEQPICSTEDEAASLYSDSDELNQQYIIQQNKLGHGTYVIRKGRKQRQRLAEMDSMSSINSKLSNEEKNIINVPSPVFPASIMIPNSRHSIDLGSATTSPPLPLPYVQNSINSPRSRLSLDLSSPTSELPANTNLATSSTIISPRYTEFKSYSSTFDGLQALENNIINNSNNNLSILNGNNSNINNNLLNNNNSNSNNNININNNNNNNNSNSIMNGGLPLMRVSSLPAITPPIITGDTMSTPRRELAPPIEEDEEPDSESQRGAPLRQIENNISALLRGDIPVGRIGDIHPSARRPLGFRPGVHKSESAKEMLLSQQTFGPLPPSPPSTSPEMTESDGFPPLPPSPTPEAPEAYHDVVHGIHNIRLTTSRSRHKNDHYRDTLEHPPPVVPPHRGPSLNTLKTRSMDAGFSKSYRNGSSYGSSLHTPGTLPPELPGSSSRRRLTSGAFPKRSAHSPREERRLQTSCSLPETPIFARGCDIPRTPHRRAPDLPGTGSRTAPRTTNSTGMSSIVGIGGGRQSISQALASGEMLRMAGGPARGWYPKQRHHRPASTENLDRLHPQGSIRAWDAAGTGSRKPLTLPPNLTPKFFNKSPREALRRVTSLLIRKGNSGKEKDSKKHNKEQQDRDIFTTAVHRSPGSAGDAVPAPTTQKKKGFFKSFWKKKHCSLEQ